MTDSKFRVAYSQCPSYTDQKRLRAALEEVISIQIQDFGGSVSGKKLMFKPNFLAWRRDGDIACVHPAFLLESVKIFLDAGAKISIIETPAVQTAPAVVRAMKLDCELAKLGVPVASFAEFAPIRQVPGQCFHHVEIAREYLDFDAVVDIAKAKTHGMMMLTLCVKNLFGMIKGSERLGWHLAVGKNFEQFADLLLDLYLAVRPQFNLLDGIVCMEGNGPGSGTPAERGFIVGSSDALALDASVAPLLGCEDLLILESARRRGLLPKIEVAGTIPEIKRLRLPPPPGFLCEWGAPLPPFFKSFLREAVVAKPVLNRKLCIGCGLCEKMCPPASLKMKNGKPVFDLPHCIRCFCCQEHCPKGAITIRKTVMMKACEKVEEAVRFLFR